MAKTRNSASLKHNSSEKNDNDNTITKGRKSKNRKVISKQFKKDKAFVMLKRIESSDLLNLTTTSVKTENSIVVNSGNLITQKRHTRNSDKTQLSKTKSDNVETESSLAVSSEFQENEQQDSFIIVNSGNSSEQKRRTRNTGKLQLSKIKNDLKSDWNMTISPASQDNEQEISILVNSGNSTAQKRYTRNTAKAQLFQEEQKIQLKTTPKSVVKEKTSVKKDENVKLSNHHQDSPKKVDDVQQSISNDSTTPVSQSQSSVSEKARSLSVVQNKRSSDDSDFPIENKIMKRTRKPKSYIVASEKENILADQQQTPLKSNKSNRLSFRKALSESFNNIAADKDDDEDFKSPASHTVFKSRKKHIDDSDKKENLKEPKENTKLKLKLIENDDDDSDIYEFQSSQTSASEKEDTFIKQLAKQGKVIIKHRRQNKMKNTVAAKKKHTKTSSKVWHDIGKNLGISKQKSAIKTTKMNDIQTQSMHTDKTSDKSASVAAVKTESIKNVKFDDEIKVISEAQTTDKKVKSTTTTTTKELTAINDTINPAVTSQTNISILSISKEQQPSINDSIQQYNTLNTTESNRSIRTPQNRATLSKNELLEYAKNYVKNQTKSSTPISNKQRTKENDDLLSPILPSSPWRITSSKNLSLSKTKNPKTNVQSNETSTTAIKNVSNAENILPISFKQKDDEEKKSKTIMGPPPFAMNTTTATTTKINLMANSHKVNPIPAAQRSPLKQINIIQVVDLPPLPIRDKNSLKLSSILNRTIEFDKKNTNISNVANDSVSNYFGFDEIEKDIEEENKSENKEKDTKTEIIIPQKSKLKKKLKNLKKLLPSKCSSRIKNDNTKKIPSIFEPEDKKKQANIREMLSSTTKSNAIKMVESFVATDSSGEDTQPKIPIPEEETIINDDTVLSTNDLFSDPIEPETSLDKTKVKRTYSRHYKTKPKNYFILFSDESDEENEKREASDERKKRRGRKKKQQDDNDESQLNKFYDEFNSMCEETTNYELVTEVETSTLAES